MEMTMESLIAEGFTKEQAKVILDAHKAAITGAYVPKSRFDDVNTELTTAKGTIKERDAQITSLKTFEGTAQQLQQRVTELETANSTAAAEANKALAKERKTNALKLKLVGQTHDTDLVLNLVDIEKVTLQEDGSLIGFDDQIAALKQSKGFLFLSGDGKPAGSDGKPAGTGADGKPAGGLPGGIQVKGATPPDSRLPGDGSGITPEQFGANLAKDRIAARETIDKATKSYFGVGGN